MEIALVILILAAVAVGAFFLFGRAAELPTAPEAKPLPPEEAKAAEPAAAEPAAAEPAAEPVSEAEPVAAEPAEAKPEVPAPAPVPEPAAPRALELVPASSAEPEPAEPSPPAPAPVPTPKPKPTPLKPFLPPPPPTQQIVPFAPAPLPVEKPKVEVRVDPQAEALERARDERTRLREGLEKTRRGFVARLSRLFRGKPKVDRALKDEVEEILLTSDIGAATAEKLFAKVSDVLDRSQVADSDAVWSAIRESALQILDVDARDVKIDASNKPYVLLMIGVNGVGKTTTLGKLAARHQGEGRKVLLVAGDTFRAAAVEQLDVWARRVGCEIHRGKEGADPSSVIFEGISRARAEGHDVVLCDTAGRLHTRKELMDELDKIGRSAQKALVRGREQPVDHDAFLVLDATIGQNALSQAKLFKETMAFSGLVLTKLDGTARGGVVLGVCDELRVPVRYIGIGERVDDLRRFDPVAFCEALFSPREGDDEATD